MLRWFCIWQRITFCKFHMVCMNTSSLRADCPPCPQESRLSSFVLGHLFQGTVFVSASVKSLDPTMFAFALSEMDISAMQVSNIPHVYSPSEWSMSRLSHACVWFGHNHRVHEPYIWTSSASLSSESVSESPQTLSQVLSTCQ
jgi:hypothetical protein